MIRYLRLCVLTAGLFALSAYAIKVGQKKTEDSDRYWKIAEVVTPPEHSKPSHFWRTHTAGDVIEVYDACSTSNKALMTATKSGENGWQLKSEAAKNLRAKIDTKTQKLILSVDPGETVWAMGSRIVKPVCGQDGLPTKIVPLVVEGEQSFAAYPPESGMGHLQMSPDELPLDAPAVQLPAQSQTSEPFGDDTKVCTTTPVVQTSIRELKNIPILVVSPNMFIGAMLQGKEFAKGNIDPVTVARSGAKISLSGAVSGEDTAKSVTMAQVDQARINVMAKAQGGTVAPPDVAVFEVHSIDEALYKIGADKRFANADLKNALNVDATAGKANVLARIVQPFYTATVEKQLGAAAFKDGEGFEDRRDQVGPGNPPLVVSDVVYGRQVFLLVRSSRYTAQNLIETLSAAFKGGKGTDACTTCARPKYCTRSEPMQCTDLELPNFETVMGSLELSYYVSGGKAVDAIGPLGKANSSAQMFNVFKDLVQNPAYSKVTPTNPGVPIQFSLSYLKTGELASFKYQSADMQTNCAIVPHDYHTFVLNLSGVDDRVEVWVWQEGPFGARNRIYEGGNTSINLDGHIPAKNQNWIVQVKVYNVAGPSNVTMTLQDYYKGGVTNVIPPDGSAQSRSCWGWNCGWCVDYQLRINRNNGYREVANDTRS